MYLSKKEEEYREFLFTRINPQVSHVTGHQVRRKSTIFTCIRHEITVSSLWTNVRRNYEANHWFWDRGKSHIPYSPLLDTVRNRLHARCWLYGFPFSMEGYNPLNLITSIKLKTYNLNKAKRRFGGGKGRFFRNPQNEIPCDYCKPLDFLMWPVSSVITGGSLPESQTKGGSRRLPLDGGERRETRGGEKIKERASSCKHQDWNNLGVAFGQPCPLQLSSENPSSHRAATGHRERGLGPDLCLPPQEKLVY